jgi:hypothetical protein
MSINISGGYSKTVLTGSTAPSSTIIEPIQVNSSSPSASGQNYVLPVEINTVASYETMTLAVSATGENSSNFSVPRRVVRISTDYPVYIGLGSSSLIENQSIFLDNNEIFSITKSESPYVTAVYYRASQNNQTSNVRIYAV